jgi:ElaB/YqjD/DUF883 family membrane-anchored ribosome-binding protein
VFGLCILNPLKFDWRQRIALIIAISAFAYFIAHTLQRPKELASATPDPKIAVLEQQIGSLRSQQEQLLSQQAKSEEAKKRMREIRKRLGEFLGRGQQLMALCANEKIPPPNKEANEWAEETEKYLGHNLGPEYIARFRSGAGMPLTASSIVELGHRNLWSELNVRVYRLEQFLSELKES